MLRIARISMETITADSLFYRSSSAIFSLFLSVFSPFPFASGGKRRDLNQI